MGRAPDREMVPADYLAGRGGRASDFFIALIQIAQSGLTEPTEWAADL